MYKISKSISIDIYRPETIVLPRTIESLRGYIVILIPVSQRSHVVKTCRREREGAPRLIFVGLGDTQKKRADTVGTGCIGKGVLAHPRAGDFCLYLTYALIGYYGKPCLGRGRDIVPSLPGKTQLKDTVGNTAPGVGNRRGIYLPVVFVVGVLNVVVIGIANLGYIPAKYFIRIVRVVLAGGRGRAKRIDRTGLVGHRPTT